MAPSRNVYPQSPSPTMVSYSVIVDSSLITRSHPAVMIFRTWESKNGILDVISLGLEEVVLVVFARMFDGLACGVRYSDGIAQSDIDQPCACDWLLRIEDWVMCDSNFFLAGGCQFHDLD